MTLNVDRRCRQHRALHDSRGSVQNLPLPGRFAVALRDRFYYHLVLGRLGAGTTLNPFAATQIRVFAGIVGFSLVFTVTRKWRNVATAVRDRGAMARVSTGALFGPFLGVSLGLFAAQNTSTGIASTIMALVRVLIIIPPVLLFREKVTFREVLGAIVAVTGVGLLFW